MVPEVVGSKPIIHPIFYLEIFFDYARVAELADALGLGSSGVTRGGSSPPSRIFNLSMDQQ